MSRHITTTAGDVIDLNHVLVLIEALKTASDDELHLEGRWIDAKPHIDYIEVWIGELRNQVDAVMQFPPELGDDSPDEPLCVDGSYLEVSDIKLFVHALINLQDNHGDRCPPSRMKQIDYLISVLGQEFGEL